MESDDLAWKIDIFYKIVIDVDGPYDVSCGNQRLPLMFDVSLD